jgi:iron complex outermembrane receptor protein
VKTELFDRRLTASLAWFHLTKQNIATQNPFNPNLTDVTGEVLSRGLEIDVAGQILSEWKVIGNVTYTDTVVLKDTVDSSGAPLGNQGKRFYGVPRFGGSLWTTYAPQDGALRGWKFGTGVLAYSNREGDLPNTFQVPGFALANFMAGYEWNQGLFRVKLQLNVDNLLDKTYFVNSDGFGNVYFGSPRRFIGSIRMEF